jgi:hypothetical protein
LRFGDDFQACRAGHSPQHLCAKSTRLSKRQPSQVAAESDEFGLLVVGSSRTTQWDYAIIFAADKSPTSAASCKPHSNAAPMAFGI